MVDRKKLGKANKAKGSAYERRVAKAMTKFTGDKWVRTPMSGAWHIPGDIMRLKVAYEYTIECKNRRDITLLKVFKNPNLLTPWAEDKQIIIFNDSGTHICVVPNSLALKEPKLLSFSSLWETTIAGESYYILSLKDLCEIIGGSNDDTGATKGSA